jgi:small GTP-binding protein
MGVRKSGDRLSTSPAPRLLLTLEGVNGRLTRLRWSPDGRLLAASSREGTIGLWDADSGELVRSISEAPPGEVSDISWAPDSRLLVVSTIHNRLVIWNTEGQAVERVMPRAAEETYRGIRAVAWSPSGEAIAYNSGSEVRLWNRVTGSHDNVLRGASDRSFWSLEWSPDGRLLAAGGTDPIVRTWDRRTGAFRSLGEHSDSVDCVTWSPNGHLASASQDKTIRIWGPSLRDSTTLEAHTGIVCAVSFSHDGHLMASRGHDDTVRIWATSDWRMLAVLNEITDSRCVFFANLAFHPSRPLLATPAENDTVVHVWNIDSAELLERGVVEESIRYTTAKIVLVGDSGVGKTGLGWRIARGEFKEHASTHGQQFWAINEFGTELPDGTRCEAVLWDLAGQPDYRLVNALLLDDVDLALVLFDPTNRIEPLSGVEYWLKQLRRSKRPWTAILIGARSDRGTATMTDGELDAYCRSRNVTGGYLATSAQLGSGIPELIALVREQIPWTEMPATVTTTLFKGIKEFVLSLKEARSDEDTGDDFVLSPASLRARLEASLEARAFSDDEMMAAVGLLETHGYVTIMRGSRGNISILLAPEMLTSLASSFVLEARRNPQGLGVLEEEKLLRGDYSFGELAGLSGEDRQTLLDVAATKFLEHNLCFRETLGDRTFLVFPSLINEKRPVTEATELTEDVTYRVGGAIENIYASLVVLLGYTNTFRRTHQWQDQAQYELGVGEVCGFRQTAEREGEVEFVLYYGSRTPEHTKRLFRGLFERFLSLHDLSIFVFVPVTCECGEVLQRSVVMNQHQLGRDFGFCNNCGRRLSLPPVERLTMADQGEQKKLLYEHGVANRRTAFEAALVSVKAHIRDSGRAQRPVCFISYAWGDRLHEQWVLRLADDLKHGEVDVLLDRWHNPPGSSISDYVDRIDAADFVAVVGTQALRTKYSTRDSEPVVAAELHLINTRLRRPKQYGKRVIPLLLEGEQQTAFPPQLQDVVFVDFRDESQYFQNVLMLIWRLYELSFDNRALRELQESLYVAGDKEAKSRLGGVSAKL